MAAGSNWLSFGESRKRLTFLSGRFTGTVKASRNAVIQAGGICTDQNGDTGWTSIQQDKAYLESGRFTGTIKTSQFIGSGWGGAPPAFSNPLGANIDKNGNFATVEWFGSKVVAISGVFSTTLKDSINASASDVAGITSDWNLDTYLAFSNSGKHQKVSGQFTSTVKTSISRSGGRPLDCELDGNADAWVAHEGGKNVIYSGVFSSTVLDSQVVTVGGGTEINNRGIGRDEWSELNEDPAFTPTITDTVTLLDAIQTQGGESSVVLTDSVSTSDAAAGEQIIDLYERNVPAEIVDADTLQANYGGSGLSLLLYSGQFTSTVKKSQSGLSTTGIEGISFDTDGNTPAFDSGGDKLFLYSGQFSSTVKASLGTSSWFAWPGGVSDDRSTPDDPWVAGTGTLLQVSGKFSSTVKQSIGTGTWNAIATGLGVDDQNIPWSGSGGGSNGKVYLQSGKVTTTLKDSQSTSAISHYCEDVSFDGTDTPFITNEAAVGGRKSVLFSGQFTGTVKTSIDWANEGGPFLMRGLEHQGVDNRFRSFGGVDALAIQDAAATAIAVERSASDDVAVTDQATALERWASDELEVVQAELLVVGGTKDVRAGITRPDAIPGLAYWFDPSDPGSITLDGDGLVSALANKAPVALHTSIAQTTAGLRPRLESYEIRGQERKALAFDALQYLQSAVSAAPLDGMPYTWLWVIRDLVPGGTNGVLWHLGQTTSYMHALVNTAGVMGFVDFDGIFAPSYGPTVGSFDPGPGTPMLWTMQRQTGSVARGGYGGYEANGSNTNPSVDLSSNARLWLGDSPIGSLPPWTGLVFELVGFQRYLNASELAAVRGYLQDKWTAYIQAGFESRFSYADSIIATEQLQVDATNLSDQVVVSDQAAREATFERLIDESSSYQVTDQLLAAAIEATRVASDSILVTDTVAAGLERAPVISDTLAVTDQVDRAGGETQLIVGDIDPLQLASLNAWWDPRDPDSLFLKPNGDVNYLLSRAGNWPLYGGSSSYAPKLVTGPQGIQRAQALDYDQPSGLDRLNTQGLSGRKNWFLGEPATIFLLIQERSIPSGNPHIFTLYGPDSSNNKLQIRRLGTTIRYEWEGQGTSAFLYMNGVQAGPPRLIEITEAASGASREALIDGVSQDTDTTLAQYDYNESLFYLASQELGRLSFGGVRAFDGLVAQLIIFDEVLSTEERQRIRGWLSRAYSAGQIQNAVGGADLLWTTDVVTTERWRGAELSETITVADSVLGALEIAASAGQDDIAVTDLVGIELEGKGSDQITVADQVQPAAVYHKTTATDAAATTDAVEAVGDRLLVGVEDYIVEIVDDAQPHLVQQNILIGDVHPTAIPGLRFWFEPDICPVTYVEEEGRKLVTGLTDLSPNATALSASGSQRPELVVMENAVGRRIPILKFDGAQRLTGSGPAPGDDYTMVAAFRWLGSYTGTGRGGIFALGSGQNVLSIYEEDAGFPTNGPTLRLEDRRVFGYMDWSQNLDNSRHIWLGYRTGDSGRQTAGMRGTEQQSWGWVAGFNSDPASLAIGYSYASFLNAWLVGEVYAIGGFSRVLDHDERAAVRGYLQAKYDLRMGATWPLNQFQRFELVDVQDSTEAALGGEVERTPSDSIVVTDQLALELQAARQLAEVLAVTDAVARTIEAQRAASDTVTATDQLDVETQGAIDLLDPVSVTDLVAPEMIFEVSPPDILFLTETIQVVQEFERTISEALSVTDQVAPSLQFSIELADTITLADLVARGLEAPREAQDSLVVSDLLAREHEAVRPATDAVVVADAVARTLEAPRSAADAILVTDQVSASGAAFIVLSDGIAVVDQLVAEQTTDRVLSNALSITDQVAAGASFHKILGDVLDISTQAIVLIISDRILVELTEAGLVVADQLQPATSYVRQAVDQVGILDEMAIVFEELYLIIEQDYITVADSVERALGGEVERVLDDDLSITDEAFGGLVYDRAGSDAVAAADVVVRQLQAERVAGDLLALTEALLVEHESARSLADHVVVMDQLVRQVEAVRALADAVLVSDVAGVEGKVELADAVAVTDLCRIVHDAAVILADTIEVVDRAKVDPLVWLADALSATDGITAGLAKGIEASDSVAVDDTPAGSLISMTYEVVLIGDSLSSTIVDSVQAVELDAGRIVGDQVVAQDSAVWGWVLAALAQDTIGTTDQVQPGFVLDAAPSDLLAVADQVAAGLVVARQLADTLQAQDLAATSHDANRILGDAVEVADLVRLRVPHVGPARFIVSRQSRGNIFGKRS